MVSIKDTFPLGCILKRSVGGGVEGRLTASLLSQIGYRRGFALRAH